MKFSIQLIGLKIAVVFVPFLLKLILSYNANEKTTSYADFIIFKEHKFLRNVFSNEKLTKTYSMM